MSTVYLNGEYVPRSEATVSVDDRGFLLADGVYEVTAVYGGCMVRLDDHLERLAHGLRELRIDLDLEPLPGIHRRLLAENGLAAAPHSKVYLQVTRGVAERSHAFPGRDVRPTVYARADAWSPPSPERWEEGFTAVTVPDRRWSRVDIKSIALLPNVLAQQAAVDAGADEALFVRDGVVVEGAHANLCAVRDGTVLTHPQTNVVLPGVTRSVVLEVAREQGYPVRPRPLMVEELSEVDELFLTGTTTEVRPVVAVDGTPIGTGEPGPVTRDLFHAYRERVTPHDRS